MKARLLIIDPQNADRPPMEPTLIVEGEKGIFICTHDWALPVEAASLEDITYDQIRKALRMRPQENPSIYLSSLRQLPEEDLTSPSLLRCTREWWREVVAELAQEGKISHAPAVTALV